MGDNIKTAGSILVVDDETVILEMLHETLTREGYRCDEAASGDVAVEMLKTRQFDILLTDIVMPGIGGLELAEQAKKTQPCDARHHHDEQDYNAPVSWLWMHVSSSSTPSNRRLY